MNDVGKAEDAHGIQSNIVRIDGQRSAYIPIMKQGGDTNTIAVVDGVRQLIKHLYDIPKQMKTSIVFDQSVYVKEAIEHRTARGLSGADSHQPDDPHFPGKLSRHFSGAALHSSIRAGRVRGLVLMGGTVNTMILGGMALAFSRVIDNSVISLENIYRHLEMGAAPMVAAEVGGAEVNLAVLAATLVDVVDFFPVVFLYGVAKFLFSALALAFCLSLLASFVVAMTVIPLFCSRFLKAVPTSRSTQRKGEYEIEPTSAAGHSWMDRFNARFNRMFNKVLDYYEYWVRRAVERPGLTVHSLERRVPGKPGDLSAAGVGVFPKDRCRPVHHQPESSNRHSHRDDRTIRGEGGRLDPASRWNRRISSCIVSNIGVVPDFSSLYTTNSGPYTATVQVALNESAPAQQFRVHGPGAEGDGEPVSRYPDVLFQWLDGRCNFEHGDAGAHRRAGQQP